MTLHFHARPYVNLAQQAQRQMAAYLYARVERALEQLENEARRMLQLEAHLAEFATAYYQTVGPQAERLAQLQAGQQSATKDELAAVPIALAQSDAVAARQAEMKTRYRQVAKDIHPDRQMAVEGAGSQAEQMQYLNDAYRRGDLAAVLRCEAAMLIERMSGDQATLESALRDIERAATTYAAGYRALLNSPLNELMLRAIAAAKEGWDWMDVVAKRIERAIAEIEQSQAA